MVNKTITELPLATFLQDEDTFHITQSGIDKRGSFSFIKDEITQDTQTILNQIQILADEVEANYEDFLSRYYGALASDPSTDPNGNPPTTGDLYYNTSTSKLKVYNGSSWVNSGTDPELTMSLTTPVATGAVQAASSYGFWGLGSRAHPLTSVDLNTERNTGFYQCTSCTNAPASTGHLIQIRNQNGVSNQQQIFIENSTNKVWVRYGTGSWTSVLDSNNIQYTANTTTKASSGSLLAASGYGLWGLGGDTYPLVSADLNTERNTGFYECTNCTNKPTDSSAFGKLIQLRSQNGVTLQHQIYIDTSPSSNVWTRLGTGSWVEILKQGDDIALTAASTAKDYNGTDRRVGWVPGLVFVAGSENLQAKHLNNTNFINAAGVTLTILSSTGNDGQLVTIMTGANGFTVAQGSGVTLTWHQGGSSATGNRTIASDSVITLCRTSSTNWRIWGNGIS